MVAKLIDVELAEEGLLSLIIHPGHVVTDMGGDNAPLTAAGRAVLGTRDLRQSAKPRVVTAAGRSMPTRQERRAALRQSELGMEEFSDGIWTLPAPLTYFGLLFNTRMTVCRLSGGGLVLIAPVEVSDERRASIDALGPVRAIVAPNLMHHLYVSGWTQAYPEAWSFGPAGLGAKRPDLSLSHVLGPTFDEMFGADLRQIPIEGMPKLNESLFLHLKSATLIATDFCFLLPEARGLTGLFASLMGIKNKTRCELSFRMLIKDWAALRASLQPLRAMTVRHLSMCHHSVLSVGASQALTEVLDQLSVPAAHQE